MIIYLLTPVILFAQEVNIKWSNKFEEKDFYILFVGIVKLNINEQIIWVKKTGYRSFVISLNSNVKPTDWIVNVGDSLTQIELQDVRATSNGDINIAGLVSPFGPLNTSFPTCYT